MVLRRRLVTLLALSAMPLTAVAAQRVERNVAYRPAPDREQYLDLHVPAASKAPVVLFIHGGSLQESGERRDAPVYAGVCPGLAQRGVLCATMDYRLAP